MSDDYEGITAEGRTLVIRETGEHWTDREFTIDGELAKTVREPCKYRDGGTRTYFTDRGTVMFPHRLGVDDRTPRLNGRPVLPLAEAMARERP